MNIDFVDQTVLVAGAARGIGRGIVEEFAARGANVFAADRLKEEMAGLPAHATQLDLLDKAAVSYQIVLTKTDKIKVAGVPRLIEATLEKIRKRPAAFPAVLSTSSEKGDGLEELRAAIALAASGG